MEAKKKLFSHEFLYNHQWDLLKLSCITNDSISKIENPIDSIHHLVCPIENHRDECPDRKEYDREDHIEDVECVEHRREGYVLFPSEWIDNWLVF